MEEKRFGERESLQTIEQMLRYTMAGDTKQVRKSFTLWGIACILVGLLTYLVTSNLESDWWHATWMLLLLVPLIPATRSRSSKGEAVSHIDQSIKRLFIALGAIMYAFIAVFTFVMVTKEVNLFAFMAPLAILMTSYTSLQVWTLLGNRLNQFLSLVILLGATYFLCVVFIELPLFKSVWHLFLGIAFGVLYLLPAFNTQRGKSQA